MTTRITKKHETIYKKLSRTKKTFIEDKLTDNIGKPKELWKILRGIGAPLKNKSHSNICLEIDNHISFDKKTNCEIFKNFFGNLANDLLNKLPTPTNKFGTDSINNYYSHLRIRNKDFSFRITSELIA